MLNIRNLTQVFGKGTRDIPQVTALDQVDLDVAEGEILTVLGASGCGKTTLLRAIAGFETPSAGTISLAGRTLFDAGRTAVAAHERGIGLVPQDGALFPHLSVAQNVAFGVRSWDRRERKRRVDEALDLVGLGGFGARRPHQLSGGQQQRVALARAIAPNPRVILLDEPFSALDEYLRESLRTEVHRLLKSIGTTAVLVTHDQAEALALGDRVVVMRHGKVVQIGSPREMYYQPTDIEMARFLGEAVVVGGDVAEAEGESLTVTCPFGRLPVSCWHGKTGACCVMIRPENIHVTPDAAPHLGTEVAGLQGTVCGQTFYGHDGVIRVRVPELDDQVSVRVMGDRPFDIGQPVRLVVDRAVCTYPH